MTRSMRTALLVALILPFLQGCGEKGRQNDQAVFDEGFQTYQVRGIIAQLPSDGPPPEDLKIHHEHIPDFIGKTGEVVRNSDGTPGMKSMVMPFPELGEGVSLEGLAPGDKVVFTLKVKWLESPSGERTPRWLVSALEPLPADAEISFENKLGPATPPENPTPEPAPADDGGP
ncbi:MAG: hypothetical protein H6810_10840 [Phycisphaeraceae bacterium]|nr:MAG: hypothetical protein H6810_10840 [Phycisphaeraceae bacterium]